MIGRGGQGQPWVVGQIGAALNGERVGSPPAGDELIALICEHYEAMLLEYGTHVGARAARKHLDWYLEALGQPVDREVRKVLLATEDPRAVLAMIPSVYGGGWRLAA
jgi:tRNA-dihydrouridine synthase B